MAKLSTGEERRGGGKIILERIKKMEIAFYHGGNRSPIIKVELKGSEDRFFAAQFTNSECYLNKLTLPELEELRTALVNFHAESVDLAKEKKYFIENVDSTIHKLRFETELPYRLEYELNGKIADLAVSNSKIEKLTKINSTLHDEISKLHAELNQLYSIGGIIKEVIEINEMGGSGSRKNVREKLSSIIELIEDDDEPYYILRKP